MIYLPRKKYTITESYRTYCLLLCIVTWKSLWKKSYFVNILVSEKILKNYSIDSRKKPDIKKSHASVPLKESNRKYCLLPRIPNRCLCAMRRESSRTQRATFSRSSSGLFRDCVISSPGSKLTPTNRERPDSSGILFGRYNGWFFLFNLRSCRIWLLKP